MALSLLLSGDVSLPEMKPGCLSLNVRTLIAELHEGLFLSQLLLPPSPKKSSQESSGDTINRSISEKSQKKSSAQTSLSITNQLWDVHLASGILILRGGMSTCTTRFNTYTTISCISSLLPKHYNCSVVYSGFTLA